MGRKQLTGSGGYIGMRGAQSLSFAQGMGRGELDAESLALAMFEHLNACNVTGASAMVAADAEVDFGPAGITGSFAEKGIPFLRDLSTAFPDLRVRIRSIMGNPSTVVAEITLEGTQSGDFLGIPNQRKHIEIDQAWVLTTSTGKITSIRAYWCQSQLYRRLGVSRRDQIGG